MINGQKIWTSTAREADMMFCLVRTEPEAEKHAGISYILIDMKTPGIEVRPLKTMTGDASFNEVFFTNVRVPRENLVGDRGRGWEIATYLLRFERSMLGRSNQTETFLAGCIEVLGEAGLLDNPVYRDRLMRLEARVLAMKYHGLRLLTDRLRGRESGVSGLITKLNGCQLNYDLCALAIDAMGERGALKRGSRHVRDDEPGRPSTCSRWASSSAAEPRRSRRTSLPRRGLDCRAPGAENTRPSARKTLAPRTALAAAGRGSNAMDFGLSDAQVMLRSSVRDLLARDNPIERVRKVMESDQGVERAIHRALGEQGIAGLLVPEEHGGVGLGLLDAAVAAQELGRGRPARFIRATDGAAAARGRRER